MLDFNVRRYMLADVDLHCIFKEEYHLDNYMSH